ncbi:MAG: endonuclease Q family protein [Elusimicrobiota bacterium]
MKFVADLHIHSRFSRACSRDLRLESLGCWAQKKGVGVLSTGDFTHPAWMSEIREKLESAEEGLFRLRPVWAKAARDATPAACRAPVRFLLGTEISCVYKKGSRTRRVHHLVFAPSLAAAARIAKKLGAIGNILSDGRPILGLDSEDLLDLVLNADENACLVPAHAWTPHFGIFGSESGFDSIEECFGALSCHIFAIETGLSSNPPMNWRLSTLDRIALISNSDAHSPDKIAREANVFNAELSYAGIFSAVRSRNSSRFLKTIEFFPQEGKYYDDGHRACGRRLSQSEARRLKGRCPVCGKRATVGVMSRVERLSDRRLGAKPPGAPGYESLVPLKEILGEIIGVGPRTLSVERCYESLLTRFGPELHILRDMDLDELASSGNAEAARAIGRMRAGRAFVEPGYDGRYGRVLLTPRKRAAVNFKSPALA